MTEPASFWSPTATLSAVKRTLLAMALLLTSVFGVSGCGSDDGEAPVESRIKNSTGDDPYGVITPQSYGEPDDAYGDDENAVPGEDIDNSVVSPQRLLFNKSAAEEFYDYYDDDDYDDGRSFTDYRQDHNLDIDDDDEYEDHIDYKDLIEYDDRSDDILYLDKNDQALKSVFKLDCIEASKDDDLGERLRGVTQLLPSVLVEDIRGYPHVILNDNELKNKELEEGISPSSISDLISNC